MIKSSRNKTIDFPLSEGKEYLNKCVNASDYDGEKTDITILGDFFESITKIKDKSVDLLIVDPPYNLNKNFHGNKFKKIKNDEYAEYSQKWIDLIKPKLKDNASVYICCDWESSIILGKIVSDNFILRNRITWGREKGRGAKANWKNSMEDIFYSTVGNEFTFNLDAVKQRKKVLAPYKENGTPKDWKQTESGKFRNTCPSNFWDDISVPYWSMSENTAHPTQKPEKLIAKLILASSNRGDLVLDPFSGSGTTGVVAKKLGRRYIDIEQNPLYCCWAEKRLNECQEGSRIQGYVNGEFIDRNEKE